jgi:hypothetical protein
VADAALLEGVIHLAQPVHEEDKIRAKRAVDDELAAPMAVRALLAQEILLGRSNRARDIGIVVAINRARVRRNARERDQVGNRWRHRLKKLEQRLPRASPSNGHCRN